MQNTHDLKLILNAGIPLVCINSLDEPRTIQMLLRVCREVEKPLFQWTVTDGLRRASFGLQVAQTSRYSEPDKFLEHIKTQGEPGIYAICDFHPWLEDNPRNIRLIKDIAHKNEHGGIILIFISPELKLPRDLSRLSSKFRLSLPDNEKIQGIIRDEARKWSKRNNNQKVIADSETLQRLSANLAGLTEAEISRLVRTAIIDDGALTAQDLPELNRTKFQLMDMENVLSYEYHVNAFDQVGGMDNLRRWLDKRKLAFTNPKENTDIPKGVLLLGVQGGGKSLAAKAIAGQWQLPLLRLDMGALYNKYYGETEKNLRNSLELADRMAPCILWLDEIEKGISQDKNDSGPSQRILATLLTWMAERQSKVFLVATSNNISALPPELLRKGRIDELFFVDLPNAEARKKILEIHLEKRDLPLDAFQVPELVEATEGFVGAEIEQALVSAMYSGLSEDALVTQDMLLNEIQATSPLSLVKSEQLNELRQWALDRQIPQV